MRGNLSKHAAIQERMCVSCGSAFETRNGNRLKCKAWCGRSKKGSKRRVALNAKPGTLSQRWTTPDDGLSGPAFLSWNHFLTVTSERDRRIRCQLTAKRANRKRLLSPAVKHKITWQDVWAVMERTKGRCVHCKSLAVENRPTGERGKPIAWTYLGRRIGSLDHSRARILGGDNELENLNWCCLWCNTWPAERRPYANDHGAFYPIEPD